MGQRKDEQWPILHRFISQYRWEQIHRHLTFNIATITDSDSQQTNKQPHTFLRSRLEPVYSIIKDNCQAAVTTSSWVSIDEAMLAFCGRSKHTVKQKGKPIKEGYKVWGLASHRGYYIDWLLHSPIDGAEDCSRKVAVAFDRPGGGTKIRLAETFQVPIILLRRLKNRSPYTNLLVFLDNLFLNIDVALALLAIDIGVMGTTRKNSRGLPD